MKRYHLLRLCRQCPRVHVAVQLGCVPWHPTDPRTNALPSTRPARPTLLFLPRSLPSAASPSSENKRRAFAISHAPVQTPSSSHFWRPRLSLFHLLCFCLPIFLFCVTGARQTTTKEDKCSELVLQLATGSIDDEAEEGCMGEARVPSPQPNPLVPRFGSGVSHSMRMFNVAGVGASASQGL